MQQQLAVQTPAADSGRLLGVDGSGRSLGLLCAGAPLGMRNGLRVPVPQRPHPGLPLCSIASIADKNRFRALGAAVARGHGTDEDAVVHGHRVGRGVSALPGPLGLPPRRAAIARHASRIRSLWCVIGLAACLSILLICTRTLGVGRLHISSSSGVSPQSGNDTPS